METSVTAIDHFDAGHVIPDYEPCARPGHGHLWTLRATVTGDLDPKTGWPRGTSILRGRVRDLCAELHLQNLDEMIGSTETSPLGLAGYFLDRLALEFPKITVVSVECSDGTAGEIRRTPRQL